MGIYDSSITRVQPVFAALFGRDTSGKGWLTQLLELAGEQSVPAKSFSKDPGSLVHDVAECFEIRVPPPTGFLRWLVKNPERMSWPVARGVRKKFGDSTQDWREKLFGFLGPEAQKEAQEFALAEIETKGAAGSLRKWWAFEGFTSVDCRLETENLLLFVEGKRKDILSPSTEWFQGRNQLFRNLEVCKEAAGGKAFGVLLITEHTQPVNPNYEMIEQGLPHMKSDERAELMQHFLGSINWREVCSATGADFEMLPDKAV